MNSIIDWRNDPSLWARPSDLPPRPPRLACGVHGNARLANRRDLAGLFAAARPGDLVLTDATVLAEERDDGASLSAHLHSGLRLSSDIRERHLLAVGSTGCGKTQKLILPQLAADIADPTRTVIALDAKGGVLPGFVAALAERYRPGQPIRVVNFKNPGRTTHRWNPAARIASRHEALEIAHAVCANLEAGTNEGRTNEAFWLFSSVNLLADVLRMLADDPKEIGSLARAKQIIDHSAYDLAVIADSHPFKASFEQRYPAVRRYLDGSNNVTQQSVIADCAMRLTLFADEAVCRVTSGPDELDLRGLVREGGVLILEVPEAHAKQLTSLTNLFVTRLLTDLLDEAMDSPGGRLTRLCSVILDELGSACGRLPDFETRLATLRSRGVAITGAVQSLKQLEHLYGATAAVAEGFATKLFFGGALSPMDAKYASELAGTCTVASETVTRTKGPSARRSLSRSLSPAARPTLLPDEVRQPHVHPLLGVPVTAFTPAAPPFYAYLVPAYERSDLAACIAEGDRRERESREQLIATRAEIARLKKVLGWDRLQDETRAWWLEAEAKLDGGILELLYSLESLGDGWMEECAQSVKPHTLPDSFRAWVTGPLPREETPRSNFTGPAQLPATKRVLANNVYLIRGKDRGREAWYYIRVTKRPTVVFEKEIQKGTVDLNDYGEILLSGWGKTPPPEAIQRAKEEWGYQGAE